jgi:hypothetical protein
MNEVLNVMLLKRHLLMHENLMQQYPSGSEPEINQHGFNPAVHVGLRVKIECEWKKVDK